jgi:hypothetical protein
MDPSELSKKIHDDAPMANKRRLLVGLSMILIAIFLTEAKLTEANTLFFKITFANMNGIVNLLLLSIGFILIRYYSYASLYQEAITKEWTEKLLKLPFFYYIHPEEPEVFGYLVEISPSYVDYVDFRHNESESVTEHFKPNLFFNAQIQYDLYSPEHGHIRDGRVYLFKHENFRRMLSAYFLVFKCWWNAQVRFRESLDIYAPYLLAFVGIGLTVCPILAKCIVQ